MRCAWLCALLVSTCGCSGVEDLGLRRENASFGRMTLDLPARGSAVFTAEGASIVSSDGRAVCQFDWPSGRLERRLELDSGHSDPAVEPLCQSSDGQWIAASCAAGRTLWLWDARTFQDARRIVLDAPRISALCLSNSGQIFVGDEHGAIRRVDPERTGGSNSGASTIELSGPRVGEGSELVFLALIADEHTLVGATRAGESFACDARTGTTLWIDAGRRVLAIDPLHGRLLTLGALEGTVELCELAAAGPPTFVRTLGPGAGSGAERLGLFVPDSELALITRPMSALGTRWDELEIVDTRDEKVRGSVRLSAPLSLCAARDGRYVISAEARSAFVWDLELLLAGR